MAKEVSTIEPVSKIPPGLSALFRDFSDAAREQLEAAWQLHVARVQEQLVSGWQREIEQVVEERFRDLSGRIAEEFEAGLTTRVAAEVSMVVPEACESACRQMSERLNQAARLVLQAESAEEWSAAVLDATDGLCGRAALFTVTAGRIKSAGARGLSGGLPDMDIAVTDAPAFAHVVESQDHVVAMGVPGEISGPLSEALGASGEAKAHLFPITGRQRVAAILYADEEGATVDAAALELIAALSATGLENVVTKATTRAGTLVAIGAPPGMTAAQPAGQDWSRMVREEQELHLRAQRFARVQVAEMRLYKSQAVRSARLNRDLYGALKEDIEAAREAYRRQFLGGSSSMVDYFHQELVRALANDDAALLGPDYPGPLV